MNLKLEPYEKEKKTLASQLIRGFWKAHNAYDEPMEEAEADLKEWTKEGHQLFFICLDETAVGLVHLGSRGAATGWKIFSSCRNTRAEGSGQKRSG